jgi:hypothetical protein
MFSLLYRHLLQLIYESVVVVNFGLVLFMAKHVSLDFFKVVIGENWKLLHLIDVKISILRYLGKHTGFQSWDFLKSFW